MTDYNEPIPIYAELDNVSRSQVGLINREFQRLNKVMITIQKNIELLTARIDVLYEELEILDERTDLLKGSQIRNDPAGL